VVSSPLQRCALFADELGARLGLPVQREADVQELHFGDWEGRSAAQIMQTEADALGSSGMTPTPSRRRPASQCWRLPSGCGGGGTPARAHAGKRVLLVTHGGVMRLLLASGRAACRVSSCCKSRSGMGR
jgi:alpha-ribazole phosphatase